MSDGREQRLADDQRRVQAVGGDEVGRLELAVHVGRIDHFEAERQPLDVTQHLHRIGDPARQRRRQPDDDLRLDLRREHPADAERGLAAAAANATVSSYVDAQASVSSFSARHTALLA